MQLSQGSINQRSSGNTSNSAMLGSQKYTNNKLSMGVSCHGERLVTQFYKHQLIMLDKNMMLISFY